MATKNMQNDNMNGGTISAAAAERAAILADARRLGIVTVELVRRAFAVGGLKIETLWAAAGAGLAEYHRRAGIVADIELVFKGERLPRAYFTGYRAGLVYREFTA